jgi:DNA-binding NarL/FixJ family response regulator
VKPTEGFPAAKSQYHRRSWRGHQHEYLEALVHGDARISSAIASRILREFTQSATAPVFLPTLTRREEEIVTLVARGLSEQRDRGYARDR